MINNPDNPCQAIEPEQHCALPLPKSSTFVKTPKKKLRRLYKILFVFLILVLCAFLIYFPGRQSLLAISLATGVGIHGIQNRVDQLEEKAIGQKPFSQEDKKFLKDLYTCMAKGAKLTFILRQSAEMMDHYLSCSGTPLRTAPKIFIKNTRVQEKIEDLRSQMLADLKTPDGIKLEYETDSFYMPHPSSPDSVFGLYYGKVILRPTITHEKEITLNWRAEVPWVWPSYESLLSKYGDYHAECFPLPNLRILFQGQEYALHIDNGLGEYLTKLGLAKPFVVFAEWEEVIPQ